MANKKIVNKKFKAIEKNAKNSPVKDIEWEGEELGVESTTKIQDDKGEGQKIIMRFFKFAANPEIFKYHKPTSQELFDSHRRGMESLIWADGLVPCNAIEPRLLFSKDNTSYQFVISCLPATGNTTVENAQTLSDLLNKVPA